MRCRCLPRSCIPPVEKGIFDQISAETLSKIKAAVGITSEMETLLDRVMQMSVENVYDLVSKQSRTTQESMEVHP